MLQKVVEYFIPVHLTSGNEYYRRVRLVAYTIFITAIFSLFYVSVSWVAGYTMGLLIMLGGFLSYMVLLFLLRHGLNVFKAANIFGLIGALGVYGCIYFSGGFESPVLPWLASTPIVILLIAGKKSGYFWAIVAVIMVVGFGTMHYNGYIFPKEYSKSREAFFFLSCHSGLVLIIFLISLVFENVRIRASKEVHQQKDELQNTLSELRATQNQLIQSEKMASLGELTAGIAHEIQNPLNFVNNFSDVNTELIDELKEQLATGNGQEAMIIANDIKDNEQKINHHGHRADAIVKGMLQHSRTSRGKKEPTDINALADEYLRLSFHGLKAKDKEFNADIKTNFDESIGKIEVVPQDIGRVLLNLYNNAFYAVSEKKKSHPEGYEPIVSVTTKKDNENVFIKVRDNGPGIPQKVLDKIFQPFFTTKPTGQGTGLGLSLSYDIIKAHGGEIKVETKEGEGAEFIIIILNSTTS